MTALQISSDPTGFPMILCEELDLWFHWYPVTKIQFELFMAESRDEHFSEETYRQILARNPRVPPYEIDPNNYWNAFVTGLRYSEIERFIEWCGPEYRLPEVREWRRAFELFSSASAEPVHWQSCAPQASALTQRLLDNLQQVSRGRSRQEADRDSRGDLKKVSRADQLFLRGGVLELVSEEGAQGRRLSFGEAHPGLQISLGSWLRVPRELNPRDDVRAGDLGFRLVRSAESTTKK